MANEELAPPGVDTSRPSIARVYDFMLGGKDNFAVDRQVGEMALKITPDAPASGRASRAFLRRVVRYLVAEVGIRQLLDIGSGLPTQGNVHEVAHEIDPQTRVVYVDNDPMVLAHGRALLADERTTTVLQADIRQPEAILTAPEVAEFIDFERPVGLLLLAILHHLGDDEDPAGTAARLRAALAPGSYVAITHFYDPGERHREASAQAHAAEDTFNRTLGTGRWRTHDEILECFGDLELVEPGLVPLPQWRPDPAQDTEDSRAYARSLSYHTLAGGVARKA